MPRDYEPVYHEPNCTQVDKSTGKHPIFDNRIHNKGASVKLMMNRVESTPHSEIITRVKEETPTVKEEVEYAEPLAPNDRSHTQAKHEHFYHSLDLNEPEKYSSGAPYSKEGKDQVTVDAKCQIQTLTSPHDSYSTHTMDEVDATNVPIPFNLDQCEFDDPMYEGIPHFVPKQTNNKNPSLNKMHHFVSPEEEDTNTPEYSDPIVPEDLDDINDREDTTVNIYNTFDDSIV